MKVTELFDKYQKVRQTCLNIEQFGSMLLMYPSLLVATADGNYDELEKRNIVSSIKESVDNDVFLTCEMYAELSYLAKIDSTKKQELFDCLKEELSRNTNYKAIVKELMTSVALVSDGVSDVEQKKIDEINNLLNL